MVNDKRYAPIAAELEDVAKRLGMEVWEVEELIYRKAEERYHLEDIKSSLKQDTKHGQEYRPKQKTPLRYALLMRIQSKQQKRKQC